MVRIIESVAPLMADYDALFCDLWGCYHNGVAPFAAAVDALRRWRAAGKAVVLMSNAPRAAEHVAGQLARMNAPTDAHDVIVTSGDAAKAALRGCVMPEALAYIGPDHDRALAENTPIRLVADAAAEGVLCAGLRDDQSETPADYADRLAALAARGLPMLCANPDIVVDKGEKRLFCAGALARDYAALGGPVIQTGKPHKPIYDLGFSEARRLTGLDAPRALMLGDGVLTDVAGAAAIGIDCVFVTGGLAAQEVSDDPETPDPARLDAFLQRHDAAPRYAIGRLR